MKRESGYNTKQKEKLLEYLISNKEKHTNVQEISAFLTAEGSPVGVATIYRQLDRLVEQGLVRVGGQELLALPSLSAYHNSGVVSGA